MFVFLRERKRRNVFDWILRRGNRPCADVEKKNCIHSPRGSHPPWKTVGLSKPKNRRPPKTALQMSMKSGRAGKRREIGKECAFRFRKKPCGYRAKKNASKRQGIDSWRLRKRLPSMEIDSLGPKGKGIAKPQPLKGQTN